MAFDDADGAHETSRLGTLTFSWMRIGAPVLLLVMLEFCICVASVLVAVHMRFDGEVLQGAFGESGSPLPTALLFGTVMPLALLGTSPYRSGVRSGVLGTFLRSAIGFACGAVTLVLAFYLVPSLHLERDVFGVAILVAFPVIGTIRPVYFQHVGADLPKLRLLVLGAGVRAQTIHRRLRRRIDRRGFRVVGHLALPTDRSLAVHSTQLVALEGRPLLEWCIEHEIDEIVVAADERREGTPLEELLECRLHGLDVADLLSFFEREQGKLPLDILCPDWLVYSERFERGLSRDVIKRLFDVLASLAILAITGPVALLVAVAIKIEDGVAAPVLCREVRTGRRGRPFELLTFRSTSLDAERVGGACRTASSGAHATRTGERIRKVRADELPRILNVLRGDMSLVGPRPERPRFIAQLSEAVPYYRERHAVKPGITGWAQVCHPCGESFDDALQRQEFDLYYVKNHTLFLDVLILCRTVEAVLFGRGGR